MTKVNETVNAVTQATETEALAPVVHPAQAPALGGEFINEKQLTQSEAAQAVQVLAKVSAYVGAKSHPADEFLGTPVKIFGAITQPVQVGHDYTDPETGEKARAYIPATRTILKLENGEVISLVSKAAESFVNNFLFPIFGKGDFSVPITLKITQVTKGQNRTFNFQIVG